METKSPAIGSIGWRNGLVSSFQIAKHFGSLNSTGSPNTGGEIIGTPHKKKGTVPDFRP
jgi:hypothetical protein